MTSNRREILQSKKLQDGSELRLLTWVSDFISPGERGYQLTLHRKSGLITQNPTDWENYSEAQVREMYASVESERDFDELRRD